MDWLSFVIGLVIGIVIGWLISIWWRRPSPATEHRLETSDASASGSLSATRPAVERAPAGEPETAASTFAGTARTAQTPAVENRLSESRTPASGREVDSSASQLRAGQGNGNGGAPTGTTAMQPETRMVHEDVIDDFTRLWGIGPKIDSLLKGANLVRFHQLATIDIEQLNGILERAGRRFQLSSPELQKSWKVQARMAAEQRWEELDAFQAQLAAGRYSKQ